MELFNVIRHQQAGKSKTIQTPIVMGVTKAIADKIIARSPKTVADTVYQLTPA